MSPGVHGSSGFTLLELMVALAIFSVAALAMLKYSSQSVNQQEIMEEKTLALWTAENAMATLRLETPWPPTGTTVNSVEHARREWRVTVRVSDTVVDTLRKVSVSVARQESDSELSSLTGYVGKH